MAGGGREDEDVPESAPEAGAAAGGEAKSIAVFDTWAFLDPVSRLGLTAIVDIMGAARRTRFSM